MKARIKRMLALGIAATMMLTGCGGGAQGGGSGSSDEIKDLYTWETSNREMENFFLCHTEMASDLNVLTNAISGLLGTNEKGQLVPEIAETWGTEDGGLTWTFNLRQGVKWVDVNGEEKAEVTANDWVTALEWILNFYKNEGTNTSMPTALIKGAQEYYDWTKELSEEEGKATDTSKFLEMVGIEAVDDYTLKYTCAYACPYFDTVCTSACLYPLCQQLVDEIGSVEGMWGLNNETMWYNGCYTITEAIIGNSKTFTKNPLYWDTDAKLFDTVTVKIIEDTTKGYDLYTNNELDHIDLSEANLRSIYDDESNQYHDQLVEKLPRKYSYQMHLNYAKNNEDGTPDDNWNKAVASENFRKSLYFGLDLTNYWARTNFIYPIHCENLCYTMKGLLYFSDGTDYVDKVQAQMGYAPNGETSVRFDADKAAEFKAAAMEELAAKGVTFPVEIDYYIIAGSQAALDTANVLKQIFSESLGDDYVTLNIGTFVSSQTQEVVAPRLQSFVVNGWGADYGDVMNFLGQEISGSDAAYYATHYSNINDAEDADLKATYAEFSDLVNAADAITDDLDARYQGFVDAECFMLDHALTVPMQYEVAWQLTKVNDYTKSNAMYGMQSYTYKNWETSVDAYTTEQYEAFKAEASK